jgi:Ulp1 family protease
MQSLCRYMLLPSFISTGEVSRDIVENICCSGDMNTVDTMFLPVHMFSCHWGLAIFSVAEQTVFFDDGYHSSMPKQLQVNTPQILSIIYEHTGIIKYQPSAWKNSRFKVLMPDQPRNSEHGSASCGVAVICAARDICNGITSSFTWRFEEAPRLRAELMADLIELRQAKNLTH